MPEEQPDKLLSRLSGMLEYFGASPGAVDSRFGTAEQVQELQPDPTALPEPEPEPEAPKGALATLGGQQMTQRSSDTLEAARSALENYRSSRGNPSYSKDIV